MDRRKSIKTLVVSTISTSLLLNDCKPSDKKLVEKQNANASNEADRMEEEKAFNRKLEQETFFNSHELATLAVLTDIIIPADEISGSASDAKVCTFLEFIVKDKPELQTPVRGGLRWLDLQSYKRYENAFQKCNLKQQLELVDEIAYPEKARPDMKQGVAFFTLMRNLTLTAFYTSEIGVKDIGYIGNRPNQWNGVPEDVLKQYKLNYSEKELKECIRYDI